MSEFSDRPFVAGSLFGLRAFRIDTLGRLTGVVHQDVWTPRENEAVCHVEPNDAWRWAYAQMTQVGHQISAAQAGQFVRGSGIPNPLYYAASAQPSPDRPVRSKQTERLIEKVHTLAGIDCQCGFYAYFDGGNDYLKIRGGSMFISLQNGAPTRDDQARIGAVIEGYGVCVVGSRGFRASKARVAALIVPENADARTVIAAGKVQRNYPGVPTFATESEAIAAFPLTDPSPASPDDEDFWTRSAS